MFFYTLNNQQKRGVVFVHGSNSRTDGCYRVETSPSETDHLDFGRKAVVTPTPWGLQA